MQFTAICNAQYVCTKLSYRFQYLLVSNIQPSNLRFKPVIMRYYQFSIYTAWRLQQVLPTQKAKGLCFSFFVLVKTSFDRLANTSITRAANDLLFTTYRCCLSWRRTH